MEIHVYNEADPPEILVLSPEDFVHQPMRLLLHKAALQVHADTIAEAVELFLQWQQACGQTVYEYCQQHPYSTLLNGISFGFNAPPLGSEPGFLLVFYHLPYFIADMKRFLTALYSHGIGRQLVAWLGQLLGEVAVEYQLSGNHADELLAYDRLLSNHWLWRGISNTDVTGPHLSLHP